MDNYNFVLKNQNGAALLTTLMIMFIVTLIALSLNNTATNDMIISANDKNYKMAFYNSDSGVSVSSRFLEAFFIEDFEGGGSLPDTDIFDYDTDAFKEKILSKSSPEDPPDKDNDTPDIKFKIDNLNNQVKSFVTYQRTKHMSGSEKSFQFLYNFDSEGKGPGDSFAYIKAGYRHIEHF
ncbi:MAG: pilus assembly PilX N-terminal domain-containing protein [Desulforegulaceae bacterium]|jgi:hypothetical protein|nr:pilus assembly PilX N-terminal domain-containing protein [Desulforegulaceae bacterium]